MRSTNRNLSVVTSVAVAVFFGAACIRRAPAGLLDPRTAPLNTLTLTATPTFTVPLVTNTLTLTNTYTLTHTYSHTFSPVWTPTQTPTVPAGSTDTFTNTPVPATNTFTNTVPPTNTFTHTYTVPVPTATYTPTTAGPGPYMIQGESPFSMVINAGWTTAAYPDADMTNGAPPYTTWTAMTTWGSSCTGDGTMYGGHNGEVGVGATWCSPLATFTTFNVAQETSDKYAGNGSLKFWGQTGGNTWGGWAYWGLVMYPSWSGCQFGLDPFLTGITYWSKDLLPDGNPTDGFTIGPTGTDISTPGGDSGWTAPAVTFSSSWTQYWAPFLIMDSDFPDNLPITDFTATGPTRATGIEGSGAGRGACSYAYLLDEVKFY